MKQRYYSPNHHEHSKDPSPNNNKTSEEVALRHSVSAMKVP